MRRAEVPADSPALALDRDQLTQRERRLWRMALLLVFALAVGLAATSWGGIRTLQQRLEALPIGLVVLAALFVAYAWSKTTEIAELRGLVRGIQQGSSAERDAGQLDQLFSLVSKSQQGYRDLIDTFEDLLFSISLDGEILAVNRSFADLLGRSFADVVGRPLEEFLEFPDSGGRAFTESSLAPFLERRRWAGVVRARLKEKGSTHYFDCTFYAIVRDGAVQGISGLARDITRERENETRFTDLFETLREGVYLASADDHITEANPALAQMLGLPGKESLVGTGLASIYGNAANRAEERAQLEAQGFLRAREITLKQGPDGRDLVVLHTAAVTRDPSGKIARYLGTFLDITEQREMERRLHREQEFARRLMDSFPDLVITLDTDARYTFTSPHVVEVLGYRPEDLIGRKLGDLADPHDRPAVLEIIGDLLAGRRSNCQIEFHKLHRDGTWRLLRATARPLHDERGRTVGVIASLRDITEHARMQQQLIQSERLAAMGQMIAGVAHELNNPLTAILGVTEIMHEQTSNETARRHLELASRQARRAAHIVQSLLFFSRPATPRKALLHLSDLLQRTLQLQERSLKNNHVQVDFVPRAELPTVLGDANQLTQVFLNLITNAEQAIREVRQKGTLRIRLGMVGERALITFQDDGVGIRREVLPRIFDPFFTTKRPGRGTGLGLSICMAIVREHNGDISAQPLPDGGAVFTVSLPVCTQAVLLPEFEQAPARPAEAPVPSEAPLTGKRILVVEDEEGIRELVAESLAARGMDVECVASAEQAREALAHNSYDAVLCDVHLESESGGAVSGFELHKSISERLSTQQRAAPPFIFMTGDLVDPTDSERIARQGNRLLQKPFRIAELLSLLAESFATAAVTEPKNSPS
jgi:PAS domain S-box-containing protein